MQGHGSDQEPREQDTPPASTPGPWGGRRQQGPAVPPGAMPGWTARRNPDTGQGPPPAQEGWQQPAQHSEGPGWSQQGNQGWQRPVHPAGNPGWQHSNDITRDGPGGHQHQQGGAGEAAPDSWQPAISQDHPPAQSAWGGQPRDGTVPSDATIPAPPAPAFQRPALEVPQQHPPGSGQQPNQQAAAQQHRIPSRKRTIPLGLFIGAALAVALGTAGAVWAFTRVGSDGASAESARMLPPSTLMYMTMTTDATSRQWVQVAQLLKRLGVDGDARQARDQGARETGLRWDEDIAPFLGGQATFAITGMSDGMPAVVAILETSDSQKAWERVTGVLNDQSPTKPVESTHRGVTIRTYEEAGIEVSLARKDRHLLVSNSIATLKHILDIEAGIGTSLAASDRFKAARAAITGDVLFFSYLDVPELTRIGSDLASMFGPQPVDEVLASAGLENAGLALAFSAETTGFKLQWQLVGIDSSRVNVKLPAAGGDSRLARRAPDSTLFYLYGNDLYNGMIKAMRQSVEQLRSDPNTSGQATKFESMWNQLTAELGFDVEKDFFAHLTGEYAVAAGVRTSNLEDFWVLSMSEVKDTAVVGRSVNRLTDWGRRQGYRIATPRVGSVTVTEATVEGEGFSYALVDNDVLFGYGLDTVRRSLESKSNLAGNAPFQEALRGLPADRVLTGFIDLQKVFELARNSGMRDMLNSPATRHLSYLSLASTQHDDRYGAILFLRVTGE